MAKSSMSQFEPLPLDAVVYRALLRKQWIDSCGTIGGFVGEAIAYRMATKVMYRPN